MPDEKLNDEELTAAVRIGVMRLARRLRLERGANDLTLSQLAALGTLRREGPQTIGELATAEHVKPPSMTRTVNCLEELELVERRAHESDGRQVVVGLTARAEEMIAEIQRSRDAWLSTVLDTLTDAERNVLRKVAPVLKRMAQHDGPGR